MFRAILGLLAGLALAVVAADAATSAERAAKARPTAAEPLVRDYASAHFLVHTDLAPKEAAELLKDLETMLKLIATYWGRPPSGVIECWVASDLSAWPPDVLAAMEPEGIAKIREGAGVCLGRTVSVGNRFLSKARVYAVAKPGVPLHEAVHAYCMQTFGRAGPQWYAEGMAELGHYWIHGQKGVNAPEPVLRYLNTAPPRTLESLIVNEERIGGTAQDYAWWWLLCHLLENNPNYSAQFRALGPELLLGRETGFRQVFGPQVRELAFELDLLRKHLEPGYRADLCAWDWKRKFFSLNIPNRTISATVQANRGWQPSGVTVAAGTAYAYSATGTWRAAKDAEPLTAQGADDGRARLVGAILLDYELGEEFELGESGTWTAPSDGNLYLRSRAPWAQVAEQSGRITVRFKLAGR